MGRGNSALSTIEPKTYRATAEAWIGQLLLPLLFFILLTLTAVNKAGLNIWIGGLGLTCLLIIDIVQFVLPMLRNWLHIDDRSIEGSLNGQPFLIYWTEILAAWMIQYGRHRYMCLGTRDGTVVIPLRFFDADTVWNLVSSLAPRQALESNAVQRLPDYHQWANLRIGKRAALPDEPVHADLREGDIVLEDEDGAEIQETSKPRTVVDHWVIQVLGWTGLTIFLLGAIKSAQANAFDITLVYGLLIGMSISLLTGWGITEFGPEEIKRNSLFGGWEMRWDEVRMIEVDPTNSIIVFVGDSSRLVVPGPALWNGPEMREAVGMMMSQAGLRGIPMRRTAAALLRRSTHSRAKK